MGTPPAVSCGFHGLIEGNWTPLHPKSIDVAVAGRAAADKGVVESSLLDPKSSGPLGYLRASNRLRRLASALENAAGATGASAGAAPSLSLLLVESGLWTRFSRTPQGYAAQIHVPGAQAGDAIAVTSEAVIAAILEGRIGAADAMGRSLLVFDGPAPAIREAADLLARAY